jgi:hypothetical protein
MVTPLAIILRFMVGFILAGALAIYLVDFPANLMLALGVGTCAALRGDKFILGFMSLMRYFR